MQFPIDFHFGSYTIDSHFVFESLAFIIGFRFFLYLRKRQTDNLATENRVIVTAMAAVGALLGSRLLGIVEDPRLLAENAGNILYYFSTKTVAGGLLGGLVATEITKKVLGVTRSSGDLITFPLILGMMIGRIGCFLSGIEDATHGIPSDMPWAMDLGDGILRHPTAAYEFLFLGILWVGIARLERWRPFSDGGKFRLFLALYLLFRFLVAFIKPVYFWPMGLSTIQIAALAGILYYWKVFIRPKTLFITPKKQSE